MTNTVRTNRFPDFGVPSNGDSSQPPSLSSGIGKNKNTWHRTNDIWNMNIASNGTSNVKRELSRTCVGTSDTSDVPSGSSALTASSEADTWPDSPWNHLKTTSPTTQSQTDNKLSSRAPNGAAAAIPSHSTAQNMLEIQNIYSQPPRSAFSNDSSFSRPQKSSCNILDHSRPFKFVSEVSTTTTPPAHKMEENISQPYPSSETLGVDFSKYLIIGNNSHRDNSSTLSGTSDTEINGGGIPLGSNSNLSTGLAGNQVINSSITSQSPAYSVLVPSLSNQTNTSRFDTSSGSDLRRIECSTEEVTSSTRNQTSNCLNNPYNISPVLSSTGAPIWNQQLKPIPLKEPYSNQTLANKFYVGKSQGLIDRGFISPGNQNENHQRFNRQTFHPQIIPSITDRYLLSNSNLSQGLGNLDRKIPYMQSSQPQSYMLGTQIHGPVPHLNDLSRATLRPWHSSLTCNSHPILPQSYQNSHLVMTHTKKENDIGTGFRSVLLEEFRANTKLNKRYDLKDIYHHIVEFSGDQHGSRLIQTKLETANSDEKEQVFREIQPNALQLMTDVYGNYVIQKLFEHGDQVQKRVLAEQMKNHVMELSLQMYGCRVVQKALEHVLDDQQVKLVEELQADVLKCVKDQNGNHVVQKAIERVPTKKIQFIIDAFLGKVETLAVHPYGCRVIQRILEFSRPEDQVNILKELHECLGMLITDQYGNYVTQHLIQHGAPEDRNEIINLVTKQLLKLSKHKYASNVVEKSIIFGTDEQRRLMVTLLTTSNSNGTNALQIMMKDQFGNYVIQKLLAQIHGLEKAAFLNAMRTQLSQLKKNNYGKQIDVIEKLLFKNSPVSQPLTPSSSPIQKNPSSQ